MGRIRDFLGFVAKGLVVVYVPLVYSQEEISPHPQKGLTFQNQNSIQAGVEYDSNVFKTFGQNQEDFLARILLKSQGTFFPSSEWRIGWDYQGGGKKYLDHDEQDTLIQFIELPISWGEPSTGIEVSFIPDIKYQKERNNVDINSLDINEDFLSATGKLLARISLPHRLQLEPSGGFTYFHFDPTQTFSFSREWGGVSIYKTVYHLVGIGSQYTYSRQQFQESSREDREHQISAFVQYLKVPFFSARYTFQDSESSDRTFTFTNHRISFLLSMIFGHRNGGKASLESDPINSSALFALHLLGTLQLKRFPSVFDFTQEGQRFLLTGSEDDNFNSFLAKMSYHPFNPITFEVKYTRYSNELSSQQDSFGRYFLYGGVRFSF